MEVNFLGANAWQQGTWNASSAPPSRLTLPATDAADVEQAKDAEREAFHDFVGQTFFSQMLSTMRKSVGKPAYFHGGRAEEIFQNQLDQVLAEDFSEKTEDRFSQPMYELFALARRA